MSPILIKNARVIDSNQDRQADLEIRNGLIARVADNIDDGASDLQTIDAQGRILMPGWIDPHVHLRDPGFPDKEDFYSGSMAAVAGGVTSVFDMPNTQPPTLTSVQLAQKGKMAMQKSLVHYGFFIGAGPGNLAELTKPHNVPGIKLYLNTTTGNLRMDDRALWQEIYTTGHLVALHAEDDTFLEALGIWIKCHSPCALHLCHASRGMEIAAIREFRQQHPAQAKNLTLEVAPHHLLLSVEDRKRLGVICCMKPELASKDDCKDLWNAIYNKEINCFATDHAPHTMEDKHNGAFGIPGLETMLPLICSEWIDRGLDFRQLAAMTSANVVDLFRMNVNKGFIEAGQDADLVLIETGINSQINPELFLSKSQWTPFAGYAIKAKVSATIVAGRLVYSEGKVVDPEPFGQALQFHSRLT